MGAPLADVLASLLGLAAACAWVRFRFRWLDRRNRPNVLAGVSHAQYAVAFLFWVVGTFLLVDRATGTNAARGRAFWFCASGFVAGAAVVTAWTWRQARRRHLIR